METLHTAQVVEMGASRKFYAAAAISYAQTFPSPCYA